MKNGQPYPDTAGNPIHAHGGWMLDYDGYTYWYGEDRRDNHYAAVYRSPSDDMKNWEFRGHILSTDTPARETSARFDLTLSWEKDGHTGKVNIERPKVLYNEKTKKFVLWAHYENGRDYREARACVASSDYPDRDFVYHGSFNPFGEMSRDCTVHTDAAGDAYFVSASRDNADLHIYRLTEDYLNVGEWVKSLYCHEYREAPALFEREGKTYMISSYCTGWAPNQGKWCAADSVTGRWGLLRDFGDGTTFRSQSAFVRKQGEKYWYIGDRWGGGGPKYFESTYVVLEIRFDAEGNPFIEYTDEPELFN
jgi:hypothetical protein